MTEPSGRRAGLPSGPEAAVQRVPHAPGPAPTPPDGGGGNPHGRGTAADLVRSLGVVIVLALALVALVPRPQGGSGRFADYAATAATAAAAASYEVLAPRPLPTDWTVVHAASQSDTATGGAHPGVIWRLDARTPQGRFVSLEQSGDAPAPLARRATGQPGLVGVARVGGWQWARHAGGGQRFLVHEAPGCTTVVAGDASWEELAAFAATLQPVR